jgi:DNA replication protein DnaC
MENRMMPPGQTRTDTCEAHGAFVAHNRIGNLWTRCPTCGAEDEARRAAARQAEVMARDAALLEQRIRTSGIPERFKDRTIGTFTAGSEAQKRALAFAAEYAENFDSVLESGRSALFIGRVGTGKTHLAAGIALHIIGKGHTALFTTALRAVRRVKDTWRRGSDETEGEAISALAHPSLLVLDEVGIQFGSDTEKMVLFDVLNDRYERRLPTLLLSNLGVEDVKTCLGERVFDRLREDGGQAIVFDWESHRGQKTPKP